MPDPNRAMVETDAARRFGGGSVRRALLVLDRYPAPDADVTTRHIAHVQLAVRQLSEGRSDRLEHFVERALAECRAVLAWVERCGIMRANAQIQAYSGMLPCFFGGLVSRLLASSSSAWISTGRVRCGSITSST